MIALNSSSESPRIRSGTRGRRSGVLVAFGFVVVVLAGCGSRDTAIQPDRISSPVPAAERATTGATAVAPVVGVAPEGVQLLGPLEFAAVIAEEGVRVVNVHIPYDGEIAGTDDFVAYDSIEMWGGRPDDTATPIAVYCRSGNMSATAARTLVDLGYTNVVDLAGGMDAWVAAGLQLERL